AVSVAPVGGLPQGGLQMFADDGVEDRVLGVARLPCPRRRASGTLAKVWIVGLTLPRPRQSSTLHGDWADSERPDFPVSPEGLAVSEGGFALCLHMTPVTPGTCRTRRLRSSCCEVKAIEAHSCRVTIPSGLTLSII